MFDVSEVSDVSDVSGVSEVSEMCSWKQNQSISLLTTLSINCNIIVFQYQTYFFIVVILGVSRFMDVTLLIFESLLFPTVEFSRRKLEQNRRSP
jgi:hypothetical protein